MAIAIRGFGNSGPPSAEEPGGPGASAGAAGQATPAPRRGAQREGAAPSREAAGGGADAPREDDGDGDDDGEG